MELLGPEEAFNQARKTGSDIFERKPHDGVYYYIDSEMFKDDEEYKNQITEQENVKTEARLKAAAIKEAKYNEALLKEQLAKQAN